MSGHWILDSDGEPVAADLMTWAEWFDKAERHVGDDRRDGRGDEDDIHVSTVFLGIDHSFGLGPPVLWETMIFGGPHDGYQERYTSRADAVAGHTGALLVAFGDQA